MGGWWLATAVAVGLSGCVLDDLDLEGRPCPCTDGYRCVDAGGDGVCLAASDGGAGPDADASAAADASPARDAGDGGADGCGATALFCNGFEEGDLSEWLGNVQTSGTSTVVSSPRHDGDWALEAVTTAAGGKATPFEAWAEALGAGDLWARAWVYAPSEEDVSGLVPLSVGDTDNGYVHAWLGSDDRLALVVGEIPPTVGLATESYPRDTWFCLRLHVVVSDDAGTAELYLGDTATPAATLAPPLDTRPPRDFSTVLVGIAHSQPDQAPVRILVDDVAVDTAPVPCE